MRFCRTMEVGECSATTSGDDDSAFANDDENINNSHVVEGVVDDERETAIGLQQQLAGATICLVQTAPDTYTIAHGLDDGQGGVQFLTGGTPGAQELQYIGATADTASPGSPIAGSLKTTHIVIHKQTLLKEANCSSPKTPTTPLPPPTPSTPLSRDRGFRYQWDQSAFDPVIPVRCKHCSGELHKSRFGSGGRGRCIRLNDEWFTPSEFEAACGRSSSKDWKRSIHYAGRTLQCLIEDGILLPHATSCTCAACCDDESVSGPVRLFIPYKRRRRDGSASDDQLRKKFAISRPLKSGSLTATPKSEDGTAVLMSFGQQIRMNENSETSEAGLIHIIPDSHVGGISLADQLLMSTPSSAASQVQSIDTNETSEHRVWNQLEEMANNLLQQAQQLKLMIEEARRHTNRDSIIELMREQFEKEKNEAVNAVRIEAQMQLARTIVEERQLKEIAMQQALAQARTELQEKFVGSVIVDDKSTFSVWSTVPTVTDAAGSCMDDMLVDGSDALVADPSADSGVEK